MYIRVMMESTVWVGRCNYFFLDASASVTFIINYYYGRDAPCWLLPHIRAAKQRLVYAFAVTNIAVTTTTVTTTTTT